MTARLNQHPWLVGAALILAVYLAVLQAGFVWDDQHLFLGEYFRSASLATLLTSDFWAAAPELGGATYYRPTLQLSFYLDRLLFGFNPAGWHLHSLMWHLLSYGLAYRLFLTVLSGWIGAEALGPSSPESLSDERLTRARWTAALGASLWALHPALSEAVAWLCARSDSMATALLLASSLCLLPKRQRPNAPERTEWPRFGLGLVFLFLALGAKENALLAPLVWVGLEWAGVRLTDSGALEGLDGSRRSDPMPRGAFAPHLVWRVLLMFGVVALMAGVRALLGLNAGVALQPEQVGVAFKRLPTVLGSWGQLMIWPWPLLALRHLRSLEEGLSLSRLSGMLVFILPWFLTFGRGRREQWRLLLVALLASLLFLGPSLLAVVQTGFVGERYLYLPLLFAVLWGMVIVWPLSEGPRARGWLVLANASLLLVFVGVLHVRLPEWASSQALFEAEVARAPSCLSRAQLASALVDAGAFERVEPLLSTELMASEGGVSTCPEAHRMAMLAATRRPVRDDAQVVRVGRRALHLSALTSPQELGYFAWSLTAVGAWDEAQSVGELAARRLPGGRGAVVAAAAALRHQDELTHQRLRQQAPDPASFEVWIARLFTVRHETEALTQLRAQGIVAEGPASPLP